MKDIIDNKVFISDDDIKKYINSLIDKVYKILPLKEEGCVTYKQYIMSVQREIIGAKSLFEQYYDVSSWVCIISILQYLIKNDYDISVCKKEVFKIIKSLDKIKNQKLKEVV